MPAKLKTARRARRRRTPPPAETYPAGWEHTVKAPLDPRHMKPRDTGYPLPVNPPSRCHTLGVDRTYQPAPMPVRVEAPNP